MIHNRIRLGLCAAMALASMQASADVSGDMDRLFAGTMYNTTTPGYTMSARRGIISGGGIVVRNRNVTTGDWLTIDPPYIATGNGCAGFDLNFGAISHISSDQLEQLMRSVPSAAAAYAFKLGLSSVSPQIAEIVTNFVDKVNEVSSQFGSSCQIAQTIMDMGGENSLGAAISAAGRSLAPSKGVANDATQATQPALGDKDGAGLMADSDPDTLAKVSPGNVIWKALKLKHVDGWLDGGNDVLLQDIMSFTGTFIACYPGVEGCDFAAGHAATGGDNETDRAKTRFVPPELNLVTLVQGSTSPDGTQGATRVNVLRCNGSTSKPEGCLNPQSQSVTLMPMRERVLAVLRGLPGDQTDGIIGRLRTPGTEPTTSEENMMASLGRYGNIVLYLARHNHAEAEAFAESFASIIAADILKSYLEHLLHAANMAAGDLKDEASVAEARRLLNDAYARLRVDYGQLTVHEAEQANRMLAYYTMTKQNVLQPSYTSRPVVGSR
jgi:hypothetical protein